MTRLFQRKYEVLIETERTAILSRSIKIDQLDLNFRAVKMTKPEPNTCELTIYNLNAEHRGQLQEIEDPIVQIKAGYEDGIGGIYKGDVRDVQSNYEPPDWVTTLASGDGEKALKEARVNKSFPPGTNLSIVLIELAKAIGVGLGNTALMALRGNLLDAGTQFLNSVTVSGSAKKEFDRIVKSAGLEWSIQDGKIQILAPAEPSVELAVVLEANTGLIGSPTIGNDGVIQMRSLMNKDIEPGRLILLKSESLKGKFRAERCEYIGDTAGNDWNIDIEAIAL